MYRSSDCIEGLQNEFQYQFLPEKFRIQELRENIGGGISSELYTPRNVGISLSILSIQTLLLISLCYETYLIVKASKPSVLLL